MEWMKILMVLCEGELCFVILKFEFLYFEMFLLLFDAVLWEDG